MQVEGTASMYQDRPFLFGFGDVGRYPLVGSAAYW